MIFERAPQVGGSGMGGGGGGGGGGVLNVDEATRKAYLKHTNHPHAIDVDNEEPHPSTGSQGQEEIAPGKKMRDGRRIPEDDEDCPICYDTLKMGGKGNEAIMFHTGGGIDSCGRGEWAERRDHVLSSSRTWTFHRFAVTRLPSFPALSLSLFISLIFFAQLFISNASPCGLNLNLESEIKPVACTVDCLGMH